MTIKKLEDRNFNDYFLIVNNDNQDEAFFCFEWSVKKDEWDKLINNWENIKEVELEYTEREQDFKTYRKVVSIYASAEGEIII